MANKGWTNAEDLDIGNANVDGPKPLVAGLYSGRITQADADSTSTGKPAVKGQVTITGHFRGDALETPAKRRFTCVITKDTNFQPAQLANAAGVDGPKTSGYDDVSAFAEALLGSDVVCRVRLEPYQGRNVDKIDRFLSEEQAAEQLEGSSAAAGNDDVPAPKARRSRRSVEA